MGIDSIILSLIPLFIISIITGIMIGWLISFGACFFAVATALFIAGVINERVILSYTSIIPTIAGFIFLIDSARRIRRKSNFRIRIAQHITDGTVLERDMMSFTTSNKYEKVANEWKNKVELDIRNNIGQSEANLFLIQCPTNQSVSMENEDTKRHRIQNELNTLGGWLQWLQQRL